VRKTTRGKARREKPAVRYSIYLITLAIILMDFFMIFLYDKGAMSQMAVYADSTIDLSLLFPFAVFSYLLMKGDNLKNIIKGLGLSKDRFNVRSLAIGVGLFTIILMVELLIGLFSQATGVQLPTNVSEVLDGMPVYFLVFTFLIAPIDEEILFRGFLVPRTDIAYGGRVLVSGIITSALLFAVLHLTYLSVSQFVAAFVFGLLAGYVLKKNKSLYSTILAHALVNFLTIAIMFL
jgi:membrane protease YdiL (CAAX protease family)